MEPRIGTNGHEGRGVSKVTLLFVFISLNSWLPLPFSYATETLTVAVASSLYPTMQQQAKTFEKEHDVTVRLVSGSTGRLYNQIVQGAPFDVFIAADAERPALLVKQGKALAHHQLGQGYLGMMVGNHLFADPARLTDSSIRHIAIANPDVAPFGKVSREVLQQQGLWRALKHKFVYAQNAMQAKMMVNKGLVDAGFVPVMSDEPSIAVIQYHSILLTDDSLARLWLANVAIPTSNQLALRKP